VTPSVTVSSGATLCVEGVSRGYGKGQMDWPKDPLRARIRDIGSITTSMMQAIQDLRAEALRGIRRALAT
jgi:hypothetical protein